MKSCQLTLGQTRFEVTSYGNGTAYAIEERATGRSIYFQGDEAAQFIDELDQASDALGSYELALARLWSDYASDPLMYGSN